MTLGPRCYATSTTSRTGVGASVWGEAEPRAHRRLAPGSTRARGDAVLGPRRCGSGAICVPANLLTSEIKAIRRFTRNAGFVLRPVLREAEGFAQQREDQFRLICEPLAVLVTSMRTGKASFNSSMWVMTRMRAKSSWIELMASTNRSRPSASWVLNPSSITSV